MLRVDRSQLREPIAVFTAAAVVYLLVRAFIPFVLEVLQ